MESLYRDADARGCLREVVARPRKFLHQPADRNAGPGHNHADPLSEAAGLLSDIAEPPADQAHLPPDPVEPGRSPDLADGLLDASERTGGLIDRADNECKVELSHRR